MPEKKPLQELSIHRWTMCLSCSGQREVTRAYNVSDLLYILLYIFFNSRSRLEQLIGRNACCEVLSVVVANTLLKCFSIYPGNVTCKLCIKENN